MYFKKTTQHIIFIAALSICSLHADEAGEFDIVPTSPLEADFFDNDIPASYIEERYNTADKHNSKTETQFAIIDNMPNNDLKEDEVYIKELREPLNSISQPVLHIETTQTAETDNDVYAAAGTFIDDDGIVLIPENLVSIENSYKAEESQSTPEKDSTHNTAGEFITPDDECISAKVNVKDRYSVFSKRSFTFGYQIEYLNFSEEGANSETILNGITASYKQYLTNNTSLRITGSIAGGKVFSKNRGAIVSDTKLTFGRDYKVDQLDNLTITPYAGIALRYTNNIYAADNITSRDTLQLYLPVGFELSYNPCSDYSLFTSMEVAAIALNQNWTDYTQNYDSTTNPFSGVRAEARAGIEFETFNTTIGLSPYYKYIFTGSESSSPVKESHTHTVGFNAYIRF